MSNIVAGDIFLKIIEEVVSASQTDFEENGVSQQTLTELQQTWQQKLSTRNVAQMPWDPKPLPPAPVSQSAASSQGSTPAQPYPPQNHLQTEHPHIKREPANDGAYNGAQGPGQGYMHQAMNPALAQQRAASLLQQQFGSQANASLGAMQQRGIALPGQQKASGNLQLPGQNPQVMQQQYAQQMKQQTASQQPRIKLEDGQIDGSQYQQQRQDISYAQHDGGSDALDDWEHVMTATRSLSEQQIANNDRFVSDKVMQTSRTLDHGLMVPLGKQPRAAKHRRDHGLQHQAAVASSSTDSGIPQLDGEFDDDDEKDGIKDEEDEDAINSDLDDDEDEAANADEDDDDIDSMLCTYDKVQRVKNKWKCVLKDGVLLANGKEYVFHKAQGEFEW